MRKQPHAGIRKSPFVKSGLEDGHGRELKAPYSPGEVCWVRETWCLYQTLNMRRTSDGRSFDEISDGMYGYKEDGFDTIQDFKNHIRLISDSSFLDIFIKDDRWQSPAIMPMKASRRHVRIISCVPEQRGEWGWRVEWEESDE